MPLSHRKLSAWYHQLAQQLEAGLPLAEALPLSQGVGMPTEVLDLMAEKILQGGNVDDALRAAEAELPLADLLALSASAEAGRMPRTLHHLSERHAQLRAAKLKIVMASLYPLGVLHFGLIVLPVMRCIDPEKGFQWDTSKYLAGVLAGGVPLWVVCGVVWFLMRRGSPIVGIVARRIPVVSTYMRAQALADFTFALANFIEAGVPIGQAWATAGLVTDSPDLKRASTEIADVIQTGAPASRTLASYPCFPPEFIALYRTGESTGQVDVNLHRLSAQQQDTAGRALTVASLVYPGLLFLVVAGFVAVSAFGVFGGYVKALNEMGR